MRFRIIARCRTHRVAAFCKKPCSFLHALGRASVRVDPGARAPEERFEFRAALARGDEKTAARPEKGVALLGLGVGFWRDDENLDALLLRLGDAVRVEGRLADARIERLEVLI